MIEKKQLKNGLINFLASGFYVGYIPFAPGTFGSILGVILSLFLWYRNFLSIWIIFFVVFLGIFLSHQIVKKDKNIKDPQWIVIDEIAGVLISFYIIWHFFICKKCFPVIAIFSLFLFRIFDILKPWPISYIEDLCAKKCPSIGIMLDDIIAGIFAGFFTILSMSLIMIFTDS